MQDDRSSKSLTNLKSTWAKQPEIIKEPYADSLRNFLFYFPGIGSPCITDLLLYNSICIVGYCGAAFCERLKVFSFLLT